MLGLGGGKSFLQVAALQGGTPLRLYTQLCGKSSQYQLSFQWQQTGTSTQTHTQTCTRAHATSTPTHLGQARAEHAPGRQRLIHGFVCRQTTHMHGMNSEQQKTRWVWHWRVVDTLAHTWACLQACRKQLTGSLLPQVGTLGAGVQAPLFVGAVSVAARAAHVRAALCPITAATQLLLTQAPLANPTKQTHAPQRHFCFT
jgi:hypothetical protein